MITNHIMYGVKCSRCGHQFEDSYDGYTLWADEQQAWEAAEEEDWIERDGKHYCPACYTEDEESDDFIPKPPYPQAFRDFRHRMSSILPDLEFGRDDSRVTMHCSYSNSNTIPTDIIAQIASRYSLQLEVKEVKYGKNLIFTMKLNEE